MIFRSYVGAGALLLAVTTSVLAEGGAVQAVGSSTVYPFAVAVAETFARAGDFELPEIQSTGTGGGFKAFCAGAGPETPDLANASRKIKDAEIDSCAAAGVTPVEVKIGYDGIVLAVSHDGPDFAVTREQLVMALAKDVVVGGAVVANPYINWNDIDAALPAEKISVLGPPEGDGTRDAFVELVMTAKCPAEIKAIDEGKSCGAIRQDGAYAESGEDDSASVSILETNPATVGIFGFSFLDQNSGTLKGATVDGVGAEFENIADGTYPLSRALYFYIKKENVGVTPGLPEFAAEFTSEAAGGEEGYLVELGLIPLSADELAKSAAGAAALVGVVKS